ncbi:DegT/DnrJ/EryC1/StrS family aminotransferase [Methanosarcina mazei]|uniref:DegT/DnrJ/EryC1/StrS family aminotransferase n=1 Tax=Methanosarcina mazei TaxID=2209 RepID=UPI0009B989E3|nr:DegT/DnrJ/EryC1/StrS family aminotransferase [Methanosarcina mazei]
MRPDPYLIPRFNFDYTLTDFSTSIGSLLKGESNLESLYATFGYKDFFFTNYGRTALYVILKSLHLPPKSKIGVPLYCCTVVFDSIINAGHVPRFIDINNNYTMDPEDLKDKIEDLSAVIVIHTFGRPADMDAIKKVAAGIPIVEDCSHSLLSEYKGKITGTIGDMAIFSLAKYLSAGGGGLLIVNNRSFTESIQKEIKDLPEPSTLDEIQHTTTAYMRAFFYHKPWFGLFGLPIGLMLENKVDLMTKKSSKMTAGYKTYTDITSKKLGSFKNKVELQRKNSFFLLDRLRDSSLALPEEEKNTYYNYYLFPLRVSNRDKTCEYLRKNGIDTTKLFSETPKIAKNIYNYENDCPNTEAISKSIITIPNHYILNKKELGKVAGVITSCPYVN